MLFTMNYTQFDVGGRKAAEQPLRYEPVKRELLFLAFGHPESDLPIIRL